MMILFALFCFCVFCICFVLTGLMYLCCLDEDAEYRRNLSIGCHDTGVGSTSSFVFVVCFVLFCFFVVFVFCFVVLPRSGMEYVGMYVLIRCVCVVLFCLFCSVCSYVALFFCFFCCWCWRFLSYSPIQRRRACEEEI